VQDFFELRPPRAGPAAAHGPPAGVAGTTRGELRVVVPLRLVLARTTNLTVAILGMTAYRSGFTFELAIRRRAA